MSSVKLDAQDAAHGALKRPAIGGHTFLSNDFVPDPFVRSYVRQSLGVAQALDLQFPLGIIGSDTLAILEGNISFAVFDLEYQHAVKDWLAARGRFYVRSRLGTDGIALLAEGLQVSTGFEFGWLLRLVQTSKVLLSASADVTRSSFTVVDFRQFLDDVIVRADDPQLADQIPTVRGNGGLRFTWGASPLFGLTALYGLAGACIVAAQGQGLRALRRPGVAGGALAFVAALAFFPCLLQRARVNGNPVIQGNRATFIWEGEEAPLLVSDATGWDDHPKPFKRLSPTPRPGSSQPVWSSSVTVPRDAYVEYAFLDPISQEKFLEPLNQRTK